VIRDFATGSEVRGLEDVVLGEDRPRRPWVMLNMVTSIDGATTVAGGSTPLSDDDDRRLFHTLRAISDVVLVGAGTVREENYHPVKVDETAAARREARGQQSSPRLVIVSGRLALDPEARVFSDPGHRPTVIGSVSADAERVDRLREVADLVLLDGLSGTAIVDALGVEGRVLTEGGPTLNAVLLADGVVDEIDWTLAPVVVGGDSKRMVDGPLGREPVGFQLARVWQGERSLFLRYVRG
jgi:riboflavin-specific deaminase-like protein